nr:Hexaxilin-7 [Euplectella curvistellata]
MHLSLHPISCYLLVLLVHAAVAGSTPETEELFRIPYSDDNLHIYVLPMGEGESTVIQCPGGDIVIVDMGSMRGGWTGDRVHTFLQHQLENVRTVIVSNTSPEHYNYIAGVIGTAALGLEKVIVGGRREFYESDLDFTAWLDTHEKKVRFLNEGEPCITDCDVTSIQCGSPAKGAELNVLGANLAQNHSNSGIILQLVSQEFKLLLPGDFAGHDIEELVIYEWNLLGSSLASSHFKLARHGSADGTNGESFLLAISPSYAFASNAYPDDYDEWDPNCDIVWRLLNLQCIKKSKYISSFACGSANRGSPIRYNNWPYEIHSTAVDQQLGKLIRINVNLTEPLNASTAPQLYYIPLE